jgi:hypothetical protein
MNAVRGYAALPGGHGEAWADAFRNLMRNIYSFVSQWGIQWRTDRDKINFPTFADGLESNRVVEAISASARAGGVWTKIDRQ